MNDTDLDASLVYEYARKFQRRAELAGLGTQYPTIRAIAKRFRRTQREIMSIVEGGWVDDDRALDLLVGFRTGAGHAEFASAADFQVEAYER